MTKIFQVKEFHLSNASSMHQSTKNPLPSGDTLSPDFFTPGTPL
ncbi:hypothetical protein B4119_3937 [Parageobacillus caldoxylosilyticus]|uniref:Uncharacterized protein n=1 Tax=Saccharococcus caldoxylosilyticus TaxID=81408 RepID=A0A150M3D6_9BACL|nr:hypothetical protein B4119_3937 [Parageobacillus caldoxylosilyticus]